MRKNISRVWIIPFLGFILLLVWTSLPDSENLQDQEEILRDKTVDVVESPTLETIQYDVWKLNFTARSNSSKLCESIVMTAVKKNPEDDVGKSDDIVTFVTHASLGYIHLLKILAERWRGPISIAIYILHPGTEIKQFLEILSFLIFCDSTLKTRLSTQFLIHSSECPAHNGVYKTLKVYETKCRRPLTKLEISDEDRKIMERNYPFNSLRNLARSQIPTDLHLTADIELQPSRTLDGSFAAFYRDLEEEEKLNEYDAFVVPVIEFDPSFNYPDDKHELKTFFSNQKAQFFHEKFFAPGHRIPHKHHWLAGEMEQDSEEDVEVVWVHGITKSLHNRWEPVYIASNAVPIYDERFVGNGFNKIEQIYEMCRADYTFHILNGVFLAHAGLKQPSSNTKSREKQNQANQKLFQQFSTELDQIYGSDLKPFCDTKYY